MSESRHDMIATMGLVKNKLFPSNEQSDDRPSKKDNQKNNKLFDQFGVHQSSFFLKSWRGFVFFLKILYSKDKLLPRGHYEKF